MLTAKVAYHKTSVEDGVITAKPTYSVHLYNGDKWEMTRAFKVIENTVSADLINYLNDLCEKGYKIEFEKKEGD